MDYGYLFSANYGMIGLAETRMDIRFFIYFFIINGTNLIKQDRLFTTFLSMIYTIFLFICFLSFNGNFSGFSKLSISKSKSISGQYK
ncbi:membrane protein [Candidatus Omnitrophus magneticus]|uniref:Membrane protein n=1 Tax=Candidatus Omnitrophus magneticus TaxID=1609969 RepID=A0A0F0CV17_9BACT|nr:membrane protein [Candidatus Omnitrophus magneticus]